MGRKRYTGVDKAESIYVKGFKPKNSAQEYYMDMIRESTITFGLGPAGTGKTFIAVAMALDALLSKEVEKVILTRPIIATEDIGYLPGDMNEKIHPYIMPLFDAIEDHLGPVKAQELLDSRRIEVLPLAFMRGRSLNKAFLLLDEAQNTTKNQMKMFLTRLGYDSKMVITGDQSQNDLNLKYGEDGLSWASDKLKGVSNTISIASFEKLHIVRNPLIETMLQHLDGPEPRSYEQVGRLPRAA
jgi:phosphate starvation-inducible PhoH-like protein